MVGIPATLGLQTIARGRVWGLESLTPMLLTAGAVIMTAVACAAAIAPARRAMSVNPVEALRAD
jgi:ABC-type antimicrobial peptide transport system permease subunit